MERPPHKHAQHATAYLRAYEERNSQYVHLHTFSHHMTGSADATHNSQQAPAAMVTERRALRGYLEHAVHDKRGEADDHAGERGRLRCLVAQEGWHL